MKVAVKILWLAGVFAAQFVDPVRADESFSAPLFSVSGTARTLQAYRGQVVILNIFATWCQPCIKEIPDLNRLARNGRGKWLVLGVVTDLQEPAAVRLFEEKQGITLL